MLIEVLVAFTLFIVMVGVFSGFINVWMTSDIEQHRRHDALVTVSDYLERVTAGLMIASNDNESGVRRTTSGQAQRVGVRDVWVSVPGWVGQLADDERPTLYQVSAMGNVSGDHQVTVRVCG